MVQGVIVIHKQHANLIWYASFGSNLSRDRLLCYIKGGQPKGSEKVETGSRDPSLPIKERTHVMRHPLYFAKQSDRWQQQGVAFIGLNPDDNCQTYSSKYLITEDQFKDVVKQENDDIDLNIDFTDVMAAGAKTLNNSWYGTILYLGKEDGYPIFTFTSGWDPADVSVNPPSHAYLSIIIDGLKTTVNLTDADIVSYLLPKPGIDGYYSRKDIEKLLQNSSY